MKSPDVQRILTRSLLFALACAVSVGTGAPVAWAHETIDEDGWCCDESIKYEINRGTFTAYAPTAFSDNWTIWEQVSLAARYWNDSGTEAYLYHSGYTTECGTHGDICMIRADQWNHGTAPAYAHYYATWCAFVGCEWDKVAFYDYDIELRGENYGGSTGTDWSTSKGDPGQKFFQTMAHEFGHALALDHEFDDYNTILMSYGNSRGTQPGPDIRMLTEDDAYGLWKIYGREEKPIAFMTATLNSYSLGPTVFSWYAIQLENDSTHRTLAQPAIAYNPHAWLGEFDYAVAWTRATDRAICTELIRMIDYEEHEVVYGPQCFTQHVSWQGPSVAVGNEGQVVVAYRYERQNPDPASWERDANSRIAILRLTGDHSTWYASNPQACPGNAYNWCRTTNTPVVSYNTSADRFVIAYTEAPPSDDVVGDMHSVSLLVSQDNTGGLWTRAPYRTGYHSAYLPPGLTCRHPTNAEECLLVYSSWDESDGRMSRLYQVGIEIDAGAPSGLAALPGTAFGIGSIRRAYAHTNVAGAINGWLLTRLDYPGGETDNLSWTWRDDGAGIGGGWGTDGYITAPRTRWGYAVACNNEGGGTDWCRFAWAQD